MNEHNHDEAIHEVTAERSEHKNADHNHHHHGISIQGKFRFAVIFTALVLVFEIVFGALNLVGTVPTLQLISENSYQTFERNEEEFI